MVWRVDLLLVCEYLRHYKISAIWLVYDEKVYDG